MTLLLRLILVIALCCGFGNGAWAHALQPGFLEISHLAPDRFKVLWRVPDVAGQPMAILALLPEHCTPAEGARPESDGRAWVVTWVALCPKGLAGGTISVRGLDRQDTDVLVRFPGPDGTARSQRLTPERTAFVIPSNPGALDVLRTYLPLGFQHILEGFDHLLFVFALLLLIPNTWRLVGAITAFTVAHSITMAAATLGWVALPSAPVEAVIALSIVFLACELAKRDGTDARLSETYPWTISFTFGLLHGFGFAGALREIGVPETDVPLALLSFNLGVEIGQLVFVLAVILAYAVLRRATPARAGGVVTGPVGTRAVAYGIGGVASFWFIERLAGFWA